MTPTIMHVVRARRIDDGLLDVDAFCRAGGVHPELVRRLVELGLIEARRGRAGELVFEPAQLAVLGRIRRLRAGLSVNYAALGLVLDLLDRVTELEASARAATRYLEAQEARASQSRGPDEGG
jgi:DNA-binding transcriptional MerR regulator